LKVTDNPSAWHGEAYFGLLTQGIPNVVQHLGSFPLPTRRGMRYLLIMELKTGGTVDDWLKSDPRPWTDGQVINSLRPLTRTLGALHASGAMHRDIKPANVFIGNRKSLCLGDFGIARHGLRGRGPRADAFTPMFAATSLLEGRQEWLPSDDIYQVGLLGLSLLLGRQVFDPDWRSLRHQIRHEPLRQMLQRATGPRAARYTSAMEFHRQLASLAPTRKALTGGTRAGLASPLLDR
jgi:serine/threonine protein kinase